jgi:Tfp pilus assembly major pilin PilA
MQGKQQRRHYKSLTLQRGFGIMDAVIWLFIFAAILAAILGIRNIAWPKAQGWLEASAISTTMQQINSVYTGAPSFSGLANASVASPIFFNAKYLPGGNGAVINNRFGGTVTIGTAQVTAANDSQTYTETDVPSAACVGMANQMVDDVDVITVNNVVVKPVGGVMLPAALVTNCNAATSVTLIFQALQRH